MDNYYQNSSVFSVEGYEIHFTRYSDSILRDHFPDTIRELESILSEFRISKNEILQPGGGLHQITQRLARLLNEKGWNKKNIESSITVEGRVLTSESHE